MAKKKRTRKKPAFKDINAWIKSRPVTERRELRKLLSEIKKLLKRPERDDFAWWHGVGTRVLDFFPKGDRQYGTGVVELLADYFQPGREQADKTTTNLLYRARQLADTFTLREVRELAKKQTASGDPLTRCHVTSLLAVEDKAERNDMLRKCLKGDWSVACLCREIQNRRGRKKSAGGLSPVPPDNPSPGVALRDISILSRRWMTNHEVWFIGKRAPLSEEERKLCDESMLKEVGGAIQGLVKVRGAVKEQLQRLKQLERDLKGSTRANKRRSK